MSAAQRILIVDDSPTYAMKLQHFLETHGLRADCAGSGEDALETLNRALPDLMISDYRMPGMLGDELCRTIRMNVNTRGIPILMLTGDEDEHTEHRMLRSGADDYVRKSEDFDVLLIRVQALLRKSRVREVVSLGTPRFAAFRLLVVDDSPTYLERISSEMTAEGYRVETAATASDAIEWLALEPFDGVVLDLHLPDMSGEELCRHVVEARRTVDNAFVILALTGNESQEGAARVLAAGADDAVFKSRNMDVIKARVGALIRRKLLYEENWRIQEEFQRKEREILRERADKEEAQARAALAEQLERANRELKDTQAQLVQSAKMASLGELVAGIAHEINNPLAYVTGHLATVERSLDSIAGEVEAALSQDARHPWKKARQRLTDMGQGLERVQNLVVKLRTFSRLDEGEFKVVSVRENIESVLTILHYRHKDRIDIQCRCGEPDQVGCYPGPLNQALMNVIANAIDAIDGAGTITITTGNSEGMFFIAIADSGNGIAPEIRDRVFDPFFTTKPVGQGTGLGLAITYRIVERHQGRLEVHSEAGTGTTVVIRIPLDLGREQ